MQSYVSDFRLKSMLWRNECEEGLRKSSLRSTREDERNNSRKIQEVQCVCSRLVITRHMIFSSFSLMLLMLLTSRSRSYEQGLPHRRIGIGGLGKSSYEFRLNWGKRSL